MCRFCCVGRQDVLQSTAKHDSCACARKQCVQGSRLHKRLAASERHHEGGWLGGAALAHLDNGHLQQCRRAWNKLVSLRGQLVPMASHVVPFVHAHEQAAEGFPA